MTLKGINHVVLKVKDLKKSDYFYREILGTQRVGERLGMWFYHAGGHLHDLALVEVGNKALLPQWQATGLFHLCFNVSDEKVLASLYQRCQAAKVPILGTVDHTIMRSFYVLDPDSHVIELGVNVPDEEWSHLPNPFARDLAYSLPN